MLKPIEIPETENYYAGTDGEIYKINEKELIIKRLKTTITDQNKQKYVHLLLFKKENACQIFVPVSYLVCGAYHGFYKYNYIVKFKNKDIYDTRPDNLYWEYKKDYNGRNLIITQIDKITVAMELTETERR